MPHVPDAVDALHDELFPDRPAKDGTRYERLAALVLKILDRDAEVAHDRFLPAAPPDKSEHQIDVVVERPGRDDVRVVVECRHYKDVIEKTQVMAHWAVADQLDAHGVMVTTKGFRSGAKTFARDKGMTLLQLRAFRPETDWEGRIKEVELDLELTFRIGPTVALQPTAEEMQRLRGFGFTGAYEVREAEIIWEDAWLSDAEGAKLEPLLPALRRRGAGLEPGETVISFDPPCRVPYYDELVLVDALRWKVEDVAVPLNVVSGRGLGEPRLLVVDAVGTDLNRAVFERHLQELTITHDGRVVERR
jgi:hypothetical protein